MRITISIYFLLCILTSCQSTVDKDWILTQNDYLFWGEVSDDDSQYIWEGNSFDGIAHGEGTLYTILNDSLIKQEKLIAFWGAINTNDVINISEKEKYIGKIKEKSLDGFGILIKSPTELYIGTFQNSKPHGNLTWYKDHKVYYEGNWENGTFHGR